MQTDKKIDKQTKINRWPHKQKQRDRKNKKDSQIMIDSKNRDREKGRVCRSKNRVKNK